MDSTTADSPFLIRIPCSNPLFRAHDIRLRDDHPCCRSFSVSASASGHRPGYHGSLLNELARQQIDQILRKTPDRRRMPKQLVSVHVQPPVIPIAIIEMAAEHQHF